MREELEDTERRLEDALARLAGLEEEKNHWNFMEEVRGNGESENIEFMGIARWSEIVYIP